MLIGQLDIQVPPIVKTIFFDLFLFSTGYKVGPQFFQGLKKNAFPQLMLTIVICVSCLLIAYGVSLFFNYDTGTAAGLLAGAFSESTLIGTAAEAINQLGIPAIEKTKLINKPVAYAATYLIGATSFVFFITVIAPKLLRINLVEESQKLSESLTGETNTNPELILLIEDGLLELIKSQMKNGLGLPLLNLKKLTLI